MNLLSVVQAVNTGATDRAEAAGNTWPACRRGEQTRSWWQYRRGLCGQVAARWSHPADLAINPSLFDNMPLDPQKDLAPITLAVNSPQYLVAGPSADFSIVKFIAKAKTKPGRYS